jgi:hypothetical protein
MLWWFVGAWLASAAVVPVLLLLRTAWRAVFPRDTEAEQTQLMVEPHSAATSASTAWFAYRLRGLATSALRLPGHPPSGAQTTPKLALVGRYMLAGLLSVCALALLHVSSFSDSISIMHNLPAASTGTQASATQAAVPETGRIQPPASVVLTPYPALFSATPVTVGTDGEAAARRGLPPEPASPGEAEQAAAIQAGTGDTGEGAGADAGRQLEAAAPPLTAQVGPKVPGTGRGLGHRRASGPLVGPYVTRSSRGTWLFAPNSNGGANS